VGGIFKIVGRGGGGVYLRFGGWRIAKDFSLSSCPRNRFRINLDTFR